MKAGAPPAGICLRCLREAEELSKDASLCDAVVAADASAVDALDAAPGCVSAGTNRAPTLRLDEVAGAEGAGGWRAWVLPREVPELG